MRDAEPSVEEIVSWLGTAITQLQLHTTKLKPAEIFVDAPCIVNDLQAVLGSAIKVQYQPL